MLQTKNIKWLYGLSALFMLINALCMYADFYYFNFLPAALLVVLLALFSLDKLVLFVVFATPFTVNLDELMGGLAISLPNEPIIFGIMLLFIIKQLHQNTMDSRVMKHPITVVIVINLIWIFITSLTSDILLVSFKFLIARLWFVIVFYFILTQLFKNYSNIKKFFWLYMSSFTVVLIYTIYSHSTTGFAEEIANLVMRPFYNDHTVYGAMIAMYFPALIFFTQNKSYSPSIKFAAYLLTIVFTVALVFSYTRAAWLSLAVALGAYVLLMLRVKLNTIIAAAVLVGGIILMFQNEIIMELERNRQDASEDFNEHIQSMSNISTDASNLERLNRWDAAFSMFFDRPVFGWGPGTYSFEYAPFQMAKNKTIISTNQGDMGNAHSEYIGPLAESGVLGALTFIAIVIAALYTGFRLYYTVADYETRNIVLVVLLGFITYIVHGVLNNFLDTDKASVPFWGFLAILVAIDVYHKEAKN